MNEPILDPHLFYDCWVLTETQFDPKQLNYKETVFTIGNGYLGTRGSFSEGYPGAMAATFINGLYDDVPIYYTELVNCPDWLPLYITIDDEEFRLDKGEIFSYQRQLDLKRGILNRKISWRSPNGKTIDIYFECFASQEEKYVLGLRVQLTPIDFDGTIGIRASIDGNPEDNDGFNPWIILDQGYRNNSTWLHVRTRSSRSELGMAFKLTVSGTKAEYRDIGVPGFPTVEAKFNAVAGQTINIQKLVTVFTSREEKEPHIAARNKLQKLPNYDKLLIKHEKAWETIWDDSDIAIEASARAQFALRYNLFQLLISAPRDDDRVSIPAKTLSGFGYHGHIFWDVEFFILPFFLFTQPNIARNLLTYRYHTLEGARRKAKFHECRGAMYAWESAATGDEVTPRWAPPRNFYEEDIRIWVRDRQIHISADIAIAAWFYWQVTGDNEWMRDFGAEIILDTALFWSSRVELNIKQERYEIRNVIGPDEYHENVDNNAFTNRMVQLHLEKALKVYDWLNNNFPQKATELEEKLQVTQKRRWRWQDIVENMFIAYDEKTGLIEQFEGFFQLQYTNLDDDNYKSRTCSMQALLGIKDVNKRQILKQPDVLMLLYVMERTAETDYGKEVLSKNWDYYAKRTDITYGSSLGPAVQGLVAASLGKTGEAYDLFRLAAFVDLENTRLNAADGIHAASCGNVWQAVIFGYAGIQFTENGPVANPNLPPTWKRIQFKLYWRGKRYSFDLKSEVGSVEIKGFIFGLDGVLTDTENFHYQAWQKLADEEGIPFNREANEELRGISRRDSLVKIIGDRNYSESQIEEMMERKNSYYVEFIEGITPENLSPGVSNLMDELRAAGIKIAIGSGSENARRVIEKLGIADRFDFIADGNSVTRSKPAPDLFLYVASELGLEPSQCVVVEDATAGVEAALAAGMQTIGIGSFQRVGAAQMIVPNLEGVCWEDIQEELS